MSNIRELSQLASVINVNDETKNVGIGTLNPVSKLSVGGDLKVFGNVTAASFYGDGSNLVGISSDAFTLNNQQGSYYLDYNNFTNKPSIPTDTGDLTNNVGFVTSGIIVGYATEGYVTQQVSSLIDGAPEALNTLNELAAALNDDSSFATTVTNSLSTKISGVGIQSAGVSVGTGITTLNFIGAGNTFVVNGNAIDISISGGGGGASVSIGTEAPANPSSGDLWYSSVYGRTFIYYDDENSSQWVDAAPFNSGVFTETPTKTETNFVATSEQTSFSVNYEVGYIEVYLNGIRLSSSEYVATSGTEVILVEPTSQGDVVDIIEIATSAPAGVQGPQGETTLAGVTTTSSSSIHYPVFIAGLGSTSPYISTTSNYFTFVPSSGTLTTNELNVIGNVTATDFDATSDINFKENIKIIENPIDKVLQIKGVTFNWKENQQSSAGVIAQDIEKILPEIVKERDDKKSLNYNGLVGLLVEVVKEQQEQINILTTRIEKLEGN